MGRLTLALGYIISGDKRLLREYNISFEDKAAIMQQAAQLRLIKLHKKGNR